MNKIIAYMQEVRKEMQKVSWPPRDELVNNTMLTLFASFLLALIIFGQDQVISWVLRFIYT